MKLLITDSGPQDIEILRDMTDHGSVPDWLADILAGKTRYRPMMCSVALPGKTRDGQTHMELINCGHKSPDADKFLDRVRNLWPTKTAIPNDGLDVRIDINEGELLIGIGTDATRPVIEK